MAQAILQALQQLSRDLGVAVVTPEYEILVALLASAEVAPEDLAAASSLSRSGFFHAVDRLKHWGFIECAVSKQDRRRRIYRLAPRTAAMMVANLKLFRRSRSSFAALSLRRGDGTQALAAMTDAPEYDGLRLPHLTPEYQVLLFLFLEPGSTNGQISGAISASPTRFHAALGRLLEMGLVTRAEDSRDRRRKRYAITPQVRAAIERANARVMDWLDAVAPEEAEQGFLPSRAAAG